MKIQTTRNDILNALLFANRAINPKTTTFILSGVMLEANEKFSIYSTDLETSVKSIIEAKVLEKGKVVVPAKIIINILRSLEESKIDLIFEKRIGPGRLFASNCIYKHDNAASAVLMDDMLRYVQSDAFAPVSKLSIDILKELAEPTLAIEPGNLLKTSTFEQRHHLKNYWLQNPVPNEYEIDDTKAHTGKRALKFSLGPDDLKANKNQIGVRTGLIDFENWQKVQPGVVKFSAWCKTENVAASKGDSKLFCIAKVRYEKGDYHNIPLAFETATHGWQYLEVSWEPDRTIYAYNIVMGLKDCTGSAWFDDVYFGQPPMDLTAVVPDKSPAAVTWSNQPVTITFDSEKYFCVNDGQWRSGREVQVTKVGINKIALKHRKTDTLMEIQHVHIDITSPVIELITTPPIDQEAGVYTASADTLFAIKATDEFAPIKSVEISIDGKDFISYKKPFKLSPGKHQIRCKVSDAAGNTSNILTGEHLSGGKTSRVMLNVK